MSKTALLLATVVAALAPACAPDLESFAPDTTREEGPRFVAQAVDVRENAGVGLGLAVDQQGAPQISYLRLDEAERLPLAPQPADPQFLPAVIVANLGDDGIWTRTIVAQEALATGAAAGPAPGPTATPDPGAEPPPEPKFENLGIDDTTDVAVDGSGNRHVVWTNGNAAVQYASETEGFPSLPEDTLETIAEGTVSGVSIAMDGDRPLVAFYDGGSVKVATPSGDGWDVTTVADARVQDGSRTDLAAGDDGPVLAFGDGEATMQATRTDGGWETSVVDEDGGIGVSIASSGGDTAIAYATEAGEIKVDGDTVAEDAQPLQTPSPAAEDAAEPPLPSTGVALDGDGNTWVAWSDAQGVSYASSGEDFQRHAMPAGLGGTTPHLAPGSDGPVAAWYQFETTSLSAAVFTAEDPALAVPSPEAPIGGGGGDAECQPEEGTDLTISAPPGASADGFDKECMAAQAGEAFTVTFTNDDEGIPHNWTLYTDESANEVLGGAGSATEAITGVDETTYEVDAQDAGEFFYRCDLHPTTMTGTFVSAGEGGGAGTGGTGGSGGASPDAGQGGESPATPSPTQG